VKIILGLIFSLAADVIIKLSLVFGILAFLLVVFVAAQLFFAHSLCKDFFASGTLEGQKAAC